VVRLPDNTSLGQLPADIEIAPGTSVHVRVSAAGYRSQDLDLSYDEVKEAPERAIKLTRQKPVETGDGGWSL